MICKTKAIVTNNKVQYLFLYIIAITAKKTNKQNCIIFMLSIKKFPLLYEVPINKARFMHRKAKKTAAEKTKRATLKGCFPKIYIFLLSLFKFNSL